VKKTYREQMRLINPPLTNESLLAMFWRPIPLLFLPSVLWGTLSMSVVIGTFVAISSNYATAFSTIYGFSTWQCGMTYSGVLVGALVAIYGGGWLSDKVADLFTIRSGGIREPEMRLPTVTISLILGPLGLLLYGAGIAKAMHWIVPIVGLGLCEFSKRRCFHSLDADGCSRLCYHTSQQYCHCLRSGCPPAYCWRGRGFGIEFQRYGPLFAFYRYPRLLLTAPLAAFGFVLSFYTNPWIESAGYINAFGALAGICAAILVLWIPLYISGKEIRVWSLGLRVLKGVHWGADREVGE
jgi:hypothetical protein